ncbi:JAB domain-containing protein [Peptoniphilaceae bacterium SGI.131]
MLSLYEIFNCSNKEELYFKVKENNLEVKSLIEFIEYSKMNIENQELIFDSPDNVIKKISSIKEPKNTIIRLIFVDAKLKPVHLSNLDLDSNEDTKKVLFDSLNSGACKTFLIVNESSNKTKIKKIKEIFEISDIPVLDTFIYNKTYDSYLSEQSNNFYERSKINNSDKKLENKKLKDFSKFNKYDEYIEYYFEKEIENLDIKNDKEKILDLLKIGFQNKTNEIFGVIAYDEFNKIIDYKLLFQGGKDRNLIDKSIFIKNLLRSNPKGFMVFHNHPSGNVSPSQEDRKITFELKKISSMLDIKFLDHLIVGKENVFSIEREANIHFPKINKERKSYGR